MDEANQIEIRVSGSIGNEPLSPDNFDIREIKSLFDVVEALLYPNQKLGRAPITYSIASGSVRNIFKTTIQSAAAFMAVVSLVQKTGSLDGLEYATAKAIDEVQKSAIRNHFVYDIGSPSNPSALVISKDTSFHINDDLWADAEFYFYGVLVNAGGKDRTNIHINTKDRGLIVISTNREFLQNQQENVLYKQFMVRAKGRQNILSGEIDSSSLELISMEPYESLYNEQYLASLIKKASPRWADVSNSDEWLKNVRGTNG